MNPFSRKKPQPKTPEPPSVAAAADRMRPLPAMLTLEHSVEAALEFMEALEFDFLVVGAPVTGRLLGVVLRSVLVAECTTEGHEPSSCPLVRHLETDIDFCLENEPLDEVFRTYPGDGEQPETETEAELRALPVIVVDEFKVPVGLLWRPDD